MKSTLLALLFVLSCAGTAAEISVTDDAGRTVTLPGPAQRIVALAPHIVENLYAVGAGDHLVGVVEHSDYPAAAADIARIGAFNAVSTEAIIAAGPDLIVTWGSGNDQRIARQLSALDVPVFISEPRSLADIARNLRVLGELTGSAAKANIIARNFTRAVAELRANHASAKPVSVFFQLWNRPLQTIGGGHLINEVIELCGGHNIFDDTAVLAPRVNIEAILARNPEVIIAAGDSARRPAWLDDWYTYPGLQAVQHHALFAVNPDHTLRPTPRILSGTRQICQLLDDLR